MSVSSAPSNVWPRGLASTLARRPLVRFGAVALAGLAPLALMACSQDDAGLGVAGAPSGGSEPTTGGHTTSNQTTVAGGTSSVPPTSESVSSSGPGATGAVSSGENTTSSPQGPTYVKASSPGSNDAFGVSAAFALQGTLLAVGANGEASAAVGANGDESDNTLAEAGAVYLFGVVGGTWQQQTYLKASNTGGKDRFGSGVALSEDGTTLVVSAPGEDSAAVGIDGDQGDDTAFNVGAIYVFVRSGSEWEQQAYIKGSNTDEDDAFGSTFALSADGNTLVVGAEEEDGAATGIDGDQSDKSAPYAGAVYVFNRTGGTWTQTSYIKASNNEQGDRFGCSVTLSADADTLAVGACSEDGAATGVDGDQSSNALTGSGAVYVFSRDGGSWSQDAYIKAAQHSGYGFDAFGGALAFSAQGDVLAVGAAGEASPATGVDGDPLGTSAPFAGAAYVFVRSESGWEQQAYLKASNTRADNEFGYHVRVSPDGSRVAVGAARESGSAQGMNGVQDEASPLAGAVYVFSNAGGAWEQEAYVKGSNSTAGDLFGWSVTFTSDGQSLAIGAIGESGGAPGVNGDQALRTTSGAGALYIYDVATFGSSP